MSAQITIKTVNDHYKHLRKLVKTFQKTVNDSKIEDEKRQQAEATRLKLEQDKQKQEASKLKQEQDKQRRENIQKMLELRRQFDMLENQEWIMLENLTPLDNSQDSMALFALNRLQVAAKAAAGNISEIASVIKATAGELIANGNSMAIKILSNK
jgi:CDP-glycerol glycerophosphotransferase (TagB/SpsB family)